MELGVRLPRSSSWDYNWEGLAPGLVLRWTLRTHPAWTGRRPWEAGRPPRSSAPAALPAGSAEGKEEEPKEDSGSGRCH